MNMLVDVFRQLGVDSTFPLQFGLVIVLFLVLNQLLWKPILAAIELREEKTSKSFESAKALIERAEKTFSEYQQKLDSAKQHAAETYSQLKAEGLKQEAETVSQAEEAYRNEVGQAREVAGNELASMRTNLKQEAQSLAKLMTEKALGRSLN